MSRGSLPEVRMGDFIRYGAGAGVIAVVIREDGRGENRIITVCTHEGELRKLYVPEIDRLWRSTVGAWIWEMPQEKFLEARAKFVEKKRDEDRRHINL